MTKWVASKKTAYQNKFVLGANFSFDVLSNKLAGYLLWQKQKGLSITLHGFF
ncbi:MAG: hypothetical protein PVF37_14790 [Desulfobacterales bacterium]|jgi:hypothetical protein